MRQLPRLAPPWRLFEVKNRHWLAAGLFALVAAPIAAQTAPSFSTQRLAGHIRTLSADSFEGRAPATAGETKTVAYLVEQFRAAGVQPGGEIVDGKRQWTQRVPLLMSDFIAPPQIVLQTAVAHGPLVQGEQIALRAPLDGRDRIDVRQAPLLFVGYGVSAPERNWDDFKGQDVRGKILVELINDPDFEGGEGDFGGKAMTYYGRWTYKYEEAARRGAAGVLIVHEDAPASYGWNTVKNSNTDTRFDIVRQNPAAAHSPVEAWITRETAVQMFKAAGLDFEAAKQSAKRRDFQPVDLKSQLTVNGQAKTQTITSYNVAGVLPGTRRPDETVIFTAHHDHLGIGEPDANGDRIFNGAIDNATGVAHLIEQARAFARAPRTERSVVFLAVGAEEKGLLGSRYYVSNPLYPLAKTAGVLNTDSMGVHGPTRNFSMSGSAELGLLDMLVEEGRRQGRRFTPESNPGAGLFFRSDHFPFAQAGVPAISFKPGADLVNGGAQRGLALIQEYTAKRYHQQDDEYSAEWDMRGIVQDAQLLHAVARRLANSSDWPNWGAGSEFRSIREQSAGERAPPSGERG